MTGALVIIPLFQFVLTSFRNWIRFHLEMKRGKGSYSDCPVIKKALSYGHTEV